MHTTTDLFLQMYTFFRMWFFMFWVTTFQRQKKSWQMLTSTVHIILFMLEMGMLQYLVRILTIFHIFLNTNILQQTFTLENLFTWISISGIDLALLSLSNHSIISYGSFSMWGALLATNEDHEVIMPKDYALTDVGERINMTNIPNWTFIWSKNCVTLLNTFRKCDNKII